MSDRNSNMLYLKSSFTSAIYFKFSYFFTLVVSSFGIIMPLLPRAYVLCVESSSIIVSLR